MSLPISRSQAIKACAWLKGCFGKEIREEIFEPFTIDHICAIACQETAYVWVNWINRYTPSEILAGCVFDATGDTPETIGDRSAFPKNTAAFIAKFGREFADMLVVEGNKSREMRGFKPWGKLYKGYGIFQYDLQFVIEDEEFFRLKKWHNIRECMNRCVKELRRTFSAQGDIPEAIRAYNGSGVKARQYRDNVLQFFEWSKTVE